MALCRSVVDQLARRPARGNRGGCGRGHARPALELADVLAERVQSSAARSTSCSIRWRSTSSTTVEIPAARSGRRSQRLLTRPTLRVHVLLGIRDDALAELDAFKGRVPGLFGNVLRLDHLDVDAARAAIVEPLAEFEVLGGVPMAAEAALVAAVVDQVASGRIERRLAGRGMVDGRRGARPRRGAVPPARDGTALGSRAGGVGCHPRRDARGARGAGRIVQQHLERALGTLDAPDRDLVARLFHQLVTPSGTKIAHGVGDLSRYAGEPPERLEDVLHALSSERVVRAVPGRNGGGPRYEIYHDVLAGAVLDWGARHEADRALASEREAARRRHRRMAAIVVLALVALALMGLLTAYAFSQRSEAQQQAALASVAKRRAENEAKRRRLCPGCVSEERAKGPGKEQGCRNVGAEGEERAGGRSGPGDGGSQADADRPRRA